MATHDEILAARDAALACLDSLFRASHELEKHWRVQWDTAGEPVKGEKLLEPRTPDDVTRFIDQRIEHLTMQGHQDIMLDVEERSGRTVVIERYRRGPFPKAAELEAFLAKAKLLVKTLRRSAVVANDEALADGVCTALDLARAKQGTLVTLADRSYSNCHWAAVEYVAKFALCWPGNFPPPEVSMCKAFMQELRNAANDHAEELREIAAGIRTEAAKAIEMMTPDTGFQWSKPDRPSEWAKVFGTDARTFSRWVKADKIPVKVIDEKNIMVRLDAIPRSMNQ